jgi:hypothetical protein
MRFDIVRARDELSIDRPDASRDQVGVLKIANPDRAIETLRDEIDEAITVAGMDVELRVRRAISASTGAKCVGPKVSGTATRKRPQSSPAGRIVSLAASISAQALAAWSRNVAPLR